MSRVVNSHSFASHTADSLGDEPPFTSTLNIETSTSNVTHNIHPSFPSNVPQSVGNMPGYQYDPVQNVELPLMDGPGHANEYLSGADPTGPHSAMHHLDLNYPIPASWCSNMGHDVQHHLITDIPEHHGNQTHHGTHIPIASGPPQLEFYAQVAADLIDNDALGHAPYPHSVAGPSQGNMSSMHPRMSDSDDEDLKRRARHYLNNPGSYVDELRVWHRCSGGRRVLILLEIDDTLWAPEADEYTF